MTNLKHCMLCEHQKLNPMTGTVCGLTNTKPEFYNICPSIQIGQKFEKRYTENELKRQSLKEKAGSVYGTFFIYVVISVALMGLGLFVNTRLIESGRFSTMGFGVMLFGLLIIPYAMTSIIKFKQEYKELKKNLNEHKDFMKLYVIDLDFEIIKGEKIHGIQEYHIRFELSRKS